MLFTNPIKSLSNLSTGFCYDDDEQQMKRILSLRGVSAVTGDSKYNQNV